MKWEIAVFRFLFVCVFIAQREVLRGLQKGEGRRLAAGQLVQRQAEDDAAGEGVGGAVEDVGADVEVIVRQGGVVVVEPLLVLGNFLAFLETESNISYCAVYGDYDTDKLVIVQRKKRQDNQYDEHLGDLVDSTDSASQMAERKKILERHWRNKDRQIMTMNVTHDVFDMFGICVVRDYVKSAVTFTKK